MSVQREYEKLAAEQERQKNEADEKKAQDKTTALQMAQRLFNALKADQEFFAKQGFTPNINDANVLLEGRNKQNIICNCSTERISIQLWHGDKSLSVDHDYVAKNIAEAEQLIAKILFSDRKGLFVQKS